MPEPQETWDPTGPVKRKPQFSIRNLFLWTTIVSVGVVIMNATLAVVKSWDLPPEVGPFLAVANFSIYIMAVCGLWTFIENPTSFYFWFPAGMSVFLPVFFLLFGVGIPQIPGQIGHPLLEIISIIILCLVGVPYGIGLLLLITRRTSQRGFSLSMLVFYAGCWLWWPACAAVLSWNRWWR